MGHAILIKISFLLSMHVVFDLKLCAKHPIQFDNVYLQPPSFPLVSLPLVSQNLLMMLSRLGREAAVLGYWATLACWACKPVYVLQGCNSWALGHLRFVI